MKTLATCLAAAVVLISTQAFAFVTRIDATGAYGETITESWVSAQGVSLHDLEGKVVSYVGRDTEALALLKQITLNTWPAQNSTVVELNARTGTISIRHLVPEKSSVRLIQVVAVKAGN